MTRQTHVRKWLPFRSAAVATGVALAALVVGLATGASDAAPAQAPISTGQPAISGTAMVGRTLSASTGSWSGAQPMTFAYQWVRCDASGGRPDGSNCARISSATRATYDLRNPDVGFRLRVRVTARNGNGSATVASNPTATVVAARPVNTSRPSISGSPEQGNRLQANPGTWTGEQPITFAFQWLRCNTQGESCNEISGATDTEYVVPERDVGRTLRVRVTARNDAGSASVLSQPTAVIRAQQPTPGSSIPVSQVPNTARLVVADVQFSPNPVTSRTAPITVRIQVKDTRGFLIRDAQVFMRATPRVTSGTRAQTQTDGSVTFQLNPNSRFPQPRNGFNVQFFIKAYRAGDPPLAGVAGFRLVQVRLASA